MLLIRNGTVVDPHSALHGKRDILIDQDKIVRIAEQIKTEDAAAFLAGGAGSDSGAAPEREAAGMADARSTSTTVEGTAAATSAAYERSLSVIDAAGCIVAPGLVDTHSHFRDPGFTDKEDIHTGCRAAARGGYTSIVMMANTKPAIDCVEVLEDVLHRSAGEPVHVYSAANVTRNMEGEERTDFVSLAAAGAVVFTDDGKPIVNEYLLKDALKLAKKLGRPISLHEEDPKYVTNPGINAGGPAAAAMHLVGADRKAEAVLVERDCRLAVETGAKLCIQHISSKEGVALVRAARRENPQIHAEATPHHFSLTEDAVLAKGTLAKVNPPLRLEEDRQAIIQGIVDGTIDIIATDHAPHTAAEKAKPFTQAPSGMIGLETALGLGLRELVRPGYITLDHLLAMLTCNPADYYGLPAGRLQENGPADLCIFNPNESWTVGPHFASKASNSPFIGETLPGRVKYTIARGRIICHDGAVLF